MAVASRAEGISRIGKAATPTLIGVASVILLSLPLRLVEGVVPTPILPLAVVFFWTIYGPGFLPAVAVFFIGLLQDLLSGGPLGLWPAIYLITQQIVLSQRSYFLGREPRVVWIGFAFAAAGAGLMLWLVMSLMARMFLPIGAISAQLAATVLVFPLFRAAFRRVHRRVLVEA